MHLTTLLALAAASVPALAAPTKTSHLVPRASSCGQWDTIQTGGFTVYQDLWGESSGTGSQCTEVQSASASTISWTTSWSWSGGAGQVKSFANAGYTMSSKELSSISSIPTTWKWSYTGSSIIADVAYDMFLAPSAGSTTTEYEVMVWLGALGGAGPISSTGSAIATVTIDSQSWQLYYGLNGSMKVYSFVAASKDLTSFTGNLKDFFTYLSTSQGLPTDRYLLSIQAGTEPFSGSSAKLTTSTYSVSVS